MAVDAYVSQINAIIQQNGDGGPIVVENFDTDGMGNNYPPH